MPSLKYIIIKSESQLCIDKILQWKAVHGLRKFENHCQKHSLLFHQQWKFKLYHAKKKEKKEKKVANINNIHKFYHLYI